MMSLISSHVKIYLSSHVKISCFHSERNHFNLLMFIYRPYPPPGGKELRDVYIINKNHWLFCWFVGMLRKVFVSLRSLAISLVDKSQALMKRSRNLCRVMVFSLTCSAKLMSMGQTHTLCMSSWRMQNMEHSQTTSNGILPSFCVIKMVFQWRDIRRLCHPLILRKTLKVSSVKSNIVVVSWSLQSSASIRDHSIKFFIIFWQLCDVFWRTFWWLPFKLANQNATTGGGGVVKRYVGFPAIDTSVSHSPCMLIGQMQWEAIRKLSKRCKKLIKNFAG